MIEENEDKATERYVAETGEGSLLAETRAMVEAHMKPTLTSVKLDTGETAYIQINGDEVSVIDPGDFDDYRAIPLFQQGNTALLDLDSLIKHILRFGESEVSIVYADNNRASPSMTAIYDYRTAEEQSFGRHRAKFAVPLSDEWKAWSEHDGEALSMPEFARFLEDHIVDVIPGGSVDLSPEQQQFVNTLGGKARIAEPAKLMELATGLQVFEEGEVTQAAKLQTGESQLTVTNRHTDGAGAELRVPSMFVIGIPVFLNGPAYQVLVRLRYRKTNQGIMFFYEMWRTDRVFDHAFKESIERVENETKVPVLLGREG